MRLRLLLRLPPLMLIRLLIWLMKLLMRLR
jgi:hypothetical protein